MSQSRKASLVETLTNVGVGYVVAVAAQAVIFPAFGHAVPLAENMAMGLVFTVISIIRSYTLRRVFNAFK